MHVTFEIPLAPAAACDAILDELHLSLNRQGIDLQPGPTGQLLQQGSAIGHVILWNPPERIVIEWIPASWQPGDRLQFDMRFEPVADGTLAVDDELESLARGAGFAQARLEHPDLGALAEQVGVPEDAMPLFRNAGVSQLLIAYK